MENIKVHQLHLVMSAEDYAILHIHDIYNTTTVGKENPVEHIRNLNKTLIVNVRIETYFLPTS